MRHDPVIVISALPEEIGSVSFDQNDLINFTSDLVVVQQNSVFIEQLRETFLQPMLYIKCSPEVDRFSLHSVCS